MLLRRKLRYRFNLLVFTIIFISLFSIYFAFSLFKQEQFYDLLLSKAKTAAIFLTELEEVDSELLKKIKNYSTSTLSTENLLIFDLKHNLIFFNKSTDWPLNDALLKRVEHEKNIKFSVKNYNGVGVFYNGKKGSVIAVILAQDSEGNKILTRLRLILIIVLVVSIIIIVIAGRFYVDKSLQPIINLIEKVNSIGINNLSQRIEIGNRTDEIAKLAKAFNSMLNRMEAAFQSQKLFIANASHELRTPLTIISGRLDVLMLKARSVDEYKEAVSNTHKDILILIRTANRLLTLAHASSGFSEIRQAPLRIDDVIWTAREELKSIYPDAVVNVNLSDKIHDDKQIIVMGNEMLLVSAFLNLMENGYKYSNNNLVNIFLDTQDNHIIVKFIDDGVGIKASEISHLFEPFYRGTNTKGSKGQGIGLSIVSNVIALHNGQVTINSQPGKGSEFIVTIPLPGSVSQIKVSQT